MWQMVPLKYQFERLDIKVEDRLVEIGSAAGIIPRAVQRTIMCNKGFRKEAFAQFAARTVGHMDFTILHGHPEETNYTRRLTANVHLDLFKGTNNDGTETVAINWYLHSESDVSIL